MGESFLIKYQVNALRLLRQSRQPFARAIRTTLFKWWWVVGACVKRPEKRDQLLDHPQLLVHGLGRQWLRVSKGKGR
jgi:hypothetical protein